MSKNEGIKRAVNFTKSEENMLILLVKKYAHIIENKKTDNCMNQKKNSTWAQIAVEFNSAGTAGGNTYRSLQILKNKYLNLKKKSVKKFSEEKKEVYRTGGGRLVVNPDTDIDNNIKEIIGTRMTGLNSEFDGDRDGDAGTSTMHDFEIDNINAQDLTFVTNDLESDHTYFTDEMDVSQQVEVIPKSDNSDHIDRTSMKDLNVERDWSKNVVENIRTPVSTKLQVNNPKAARKRDNTLKTKLSCWAKTKQDFVSIQQQCLSKESQQKLQLHQEKHQEELRQSREKFQHQQEKHQEELRQSREVHEQRMINMREEHAILKLKKEKLIREMSN